MLSNVGKRKFSNELPNDLEGLQCDGDSCIVVIVAASDGRRISAHRNILSAASDYFKAMFRSNMLEARIGFDVVIHEMNSDVIIALIKYCYTGEIDINTKNVQDLMAAASLMLLEHVVEKCAIFMEMNLDVENCVGVAHFAEMFHCDFLQRRAEEVMAKEFLELLKTPEYNNLSFDRVAALIDRYDLEVNDEEEVLDAAVDWIYHKPERIPLFSQLLQRVRLPLVRFLKIRMYLLPMCRENKCEAILDEAIAWHKLNEGKQNPIRPDSLQYMPRKGQNGWLGIFCRQNDETEYDICIEHLSYGSNHWSPYTEFTLGRNEFGIVSYNDAIIIAGGRTNTNEICDLVLGIKFSSAESKWLSSLSSKRFGLGLAVHNDLIYAVGGENNEDILNCVERYDPLIDSWKMVAPMPTSRAHMAVAFMGGHLYAVGGCIGANSLDVAEVYEPHKDAWTKCASMIQPRKRFAMASKNGFLYAVGGVQSQAHNTMERYDPRVDKWIDVICLPCIPHSIACFAKMKYLYFVMSKKADLNKKMPIAVIKFEVDRNILTFEGERILQQNEPPMSLVTMVEFP